MRARPIGVIAVLAAATAVLSGCRSNVNVAATVNGERISESTVSKYVKHEGADPSLAAQAAQQGSELPAPKALVLQTLVQESLYEHTLDQHGLVPTDGQLAAVHDVAVQQQFNASGTGHALDRTVSTTLGRLGIQPSFTAVVVRYSELFYLVLQRLKPQSQTDLAADVRKAGAHVRINPRYGTWDATQQSIDSSGSAGLPHYLKLQPTQTASAQLGVPAP